MSAEPLRGLHVLVVDDDATARSLISEMLRHGGALVTVSDSVDGAYQSVGRVVPEIVVCALNLDNGLGAHELRRRFQALPTAGAPRIPIIAVARDHDLYPINEVLEAGFAGYVKSPFDPRRLCALVADVADAHPREPGAQG